MKSALVLGLALTASTFSADHYDNEFIVAPTDQFGNIKPYPRNIRFDEQADDELLVRPGFLQIADDELRFAPNDEFGRTRPYPPNIRFDEEGNELFSFSFSTPRYRNLTNRFPGIFADDELMRGPYSRRRRVDNIEGRKEDDDKADNEYVASGKAAAKKYRPGLVEHVKRHPETVFYDEGDDELIVRPGYLQIADDELIRAPSNKKNKGNVMYDDQVDDELYNNYKMSSKLFVERRVEALRRDDEVDNELLIRPVVPYVAADDELLSMSPSLFTERRAEALRRDDEIDDELAWLDELLQEASYNGGIVRALDDDEFRAEKLGHLKGQKMDRFRDHEMPEIRGKIKPLGEGGFLPFN